MASKKERETLRGILAAMAPADMEPPAGVIDAMLAEMVEMLEEGRRGGRSALPPRAERIEQVREELVRSGPVGFGPMDDAPPWSWRAEIAMAVSPDDLEVLDRVVRTMSLHGLLLHGRVPDGVEGLGTWASLDDVLDALGFDAQLAIAGADDEQLARLPLGQLLLPDDHPALAEADPTLPALVWVQQRRGERLDETVLDEPVLASVVEGWMHARAERRCSALVSALPMSRWGEAVSVYDEAMVALNMIFDMHLARAPLEVLELGRGVAWRVRELCDAMLAEPTLRDLPSSGWEASRGSMGEKSLQRLVEQLLAVMRDWRVAAAAARHPEAFEAPEVLPTLQTLVREGRLDLWSPIEDAPEVAEAAVPSGRYYELEVTLDGSKPRIWRRFLLQADATFHDLHDAIQSAFGWQHAHLWEFRVKRQTLAAMGDTDRWGYGPDAPAAHELPLAAFFEHKAACDYLYDFGDSWLHKIKCRRTVDLAPDEATFHRKLLAGRQPAPPEDCGGIWGYYELLDNPAAYGWDAESLAEHNTFELKAARERFDC